MQFVILTSFMHVHAIYMHYKSFPSTAVLCVVAVLHILRAFASATVAALKIIRIA